MEINKTYIDRVKNKPLRVGLDLEIDRPDNLVSNAGLLYFTMDPTDGSLRIRFGDGESYFNDLPVWKIPMEGVVPIKPLDLPEPKVFYSNCLLEAIKAKLRNWKNVKIYTLPPKYNEVYCPHFLWTDGVHDYDFGTCAYLRWYQRLWFKGTLKEHKLGWAQRLIQVRKGQNIKDFIPSEGEDNP